MGGQFLSQGKKENKIDVDEPLLNLNKRFLNRYKCIMTFPEEWEEF
ncbi:hypothetical protein HBHAL_3865 [Halobacillus halophilus DSM 2266]|uniref:Uncharacterized protein n=1 Tax=Halobacillus halophilus (strain ATCC 35676 / DSM 2266 / JCM 20832 / KCTC 3685 / LMG 17431 / NBRC 102448 / NCIMB 2269) TaxID=866895 RepID=I0JPY8_HALH3|nr:hypothetical protein HBHAL_3865 [Halobacillus halophilus DSM 2266]